MPLHTDARTHAHTHTELLYKHHVAHTYIDHFTNGATIHVFFDLLATLTINGCLLSMTACVFPISSAVEHQQS